MFYLVKKKQIISQTEILEYSSVNENITNLELNNLKDWLKTKDRIQYSSLKLWFTDTPWLLLMDFRELGNL
jgi:hypothetical protein